MDWFEQFSLQKFREKTVSMAFYRAKEEIKDATMDDSVRALLEILVERLGVSKVVFDRKSVEPVDYYITEDVLNTNVNEKRKYVKSRRDVMQFIKTKVKHEQSKEEAKIEKNAVGDQIKYFVLKTRSAKDIFDYFFRSK